MGETRGSLVVVATPIGNLNDVSPRAAEALRAADVVACEDTRRTATLLRAVASEAPMLPTHAHNEASRAEDLVARALVGQNVVLVSDAGVPAVSDPGRAVVDAAHAAGVAVSVVPGPSAPSAALAVSGFPADEYLFLGFLPQRGARRERAIDALAASEVSAVVFESPKRLPSLLAGLARRDPERRALVARELTKVHEEVVRGAAAELAERFATPTRGEVTVVVSPASRSEPDADHLEERLGRLLDLGLSPSAAADAAAALGVGPRNSVYRAALAAAASRRER